MRGRWLEGSQAACTFGPIDNLVDTAEVFHPTRKGHEAIKKEVLRLALKYDHPLTVQDIRNENTKLPNGTHDEIGTK